jgi:hypothetical protein
MFQWKNFLKIEDNGTVALTHHLPAEFEDGCFLASAVAVDCRLVEVAPSS